MKRIVAAVLMLALMAPAMGQTVTVPAPSAVGVAQVGQIPAVATNTAPCATCMGAPLSRETLTPGTSIANNSAKDITSQDFTAGNWIICGTPAFLTDGTTNVVELMAWISSTTASYPVDLAGGALQRNVNSAAGVVYNADPIVFPTGCRNMIFSSTTTVYLSTLAYFSLGTLTAYGRIWGWRVS